MILYLKTHLTMKSSCHFLRFVVCAAVLFPALITRSSATVSRPQRRSRSTASPDTAGAAGGGGTGTSSEDEFASRAIIGRVNASGYAALYPRASDIIHNQNSRRLKDSQGGGYVDFSLLSQGQGAERLTINCSASCTPRETLRQIRIETTKMDILRKLRITTLPNMTNHRIPNIPFVQNLIERSNQQNDSPYTATATSRSDNDQEELEADHSTTVRTIIFPQKQSSSSHSHLQHVVQFAFPSRVQNSEIVDATFGVHVRRSRHEQRPVLPTTPTFAFLHKVKAHGRTEVYAKKRLPPVLDDRGTWIQFDIKHIAREWLENPNSNHGLKIVIDDSRRRYHAVINPQNEQDELHKPYLDMSVRGRATSRQRRSAAAMTCEEGGSERRCCRYPLVIDFESFRWDWIIAPRSYHAYYCSGDCPFSYIQTQHTHTHVVQQQMRVDASSGGSCCSPRDLSPISLLYFDTNMNIISGVLPGMVVNRCSCA